MSITKDDIIDFLSDDNLEKLESQLDSSPNIFKILKSESAEIKHSNMLAYLLDPSENHGLGTKFVEKFLRLVSDDPKLFLASCDSIIVKREWKNIDLLLCSAEDKIVIAIENKVNSGEHSGQLKRYKKILEDEYKEYSRYYVFLTLEGEEAPYDSDIWKPIGYQKVIDLLENIVKISSLGNEVEVLITHYIKAIKELLKMESPEIIELKNKVFQKHKAIILELAELDGNPRLELSSMLNDFFGEWSKDNVNYSFNMKSNNTYKYFFTDNLKQIMDDKEHLWYEFWIDNLGGAFGTKIALKIRKGYTGFYENIADKLYGILSNGKKDYETTSLKKWDICYFDDNGNKKDVDTMKLEFEAVLFREIPKFEQELLSRLKQP